MADVTLVVGENEKHTIKVSASFWTGNVKVLVDGTPVSSSYALTKKNVKLPVGDKEKHDIEVKVGGVLLPKIEVWVDGRLTSVG